MDICSGDTLVHFVYHGCQAGIIVVAILLVGHLLKRRRE